MSIDYGPGDIIRFKNLPRGPQWPLVGALAECHDITDGWVHVWWLTGPRSTVRMPVEMEGWYAEQFVLRRRQGRLV